MLPVWVDITKARDAGQAGWSAEQIARTGMLVHAGNLSWGVRRLTPFQEGEIALGQEIRRISTRLRLREGARQAGWVISAPRLEVLENNRAIPLASPSFDPRWHLRMPPERWAKTVEAWQRAGFRFEDEATMTPGWREVVEKADPTTVPVPYVHLYADRKVVGTYAFLLDARHEALKRWLVAETKWALRETGADAVVLGFKSGSNENTPSFVVTPQGIRTLDQNGWVTRPLDHAGVPAVPITIAHYAPGEYLEHMMTWVRMLHAEGVEAMMNEAYPHLGTRWLWADAYPDVAARLLGEGMYREPWKV